MTSEPDSKPGRRPPTIELKATEVETPASNAAAEPADAAPKEAAAEPASPPTGEPSRGRWKFYAVGAGASALAMVAAGLWATGYLPTGSAIAPAETPSAVAPPAATSGDMTARLDKIERTVQAQQQELQHQQSQPQTPAAIPPALGNRLTAEEAQIKSLAEQISALNRRADDIAGASESAAKEAGAAAAAAEAAQHAAQDAAKDTQKSASQSGVQQSDIEALANRIAALESAVRTLADTAAHPSGGNDAAARLTVAAEALRAAVERGAPYEAELAAARSLGADQNTVAPLEAFAANGVPSASLLGRELAALTPALQEAIHAAPGETTILGRLKANAQKLVRVTPVDAPAGSDPATVIGRIARDAARADIPAALTDIAALPDSARPLAADWIAKAQARDAAIAASRQMATDALTALGKPASQ